MRTIQMTLDDDLVETVDKLVKKMKTTRSAFARKALREAIEQINIKSLEKKHTTSLNLSNSCSISREHLSPELGCRRTTVYYQVLLNLAHDWARPRRSSN